MEKEEGLSDYELQFLLASVPPATIRKRFREELDYLHSVGTLLDVIVSDLVLAHVLAYAWNHTYRLALVCKRFCKVTRSRAYWAALARHALKGKMPACILEQVNFFHGMKDDAPAHLHLQGLLMPPSKRRVIFDMRNARISFRFLGDSTNDAIYEVAWSKDELPKYCISHYDETKNNHTQRPLYRQQNCEFFNYEKCRKLVWYDKITDNGAEVSVYTYCEVYDPVRNQTWYGQPGQRESALDEMLSSSEMMPGPGSWGVWK